MESITTVSGAIECAVSVGNYMKATGYEMGDPGRKARCAAVTGGEGRRAAEHSLRLRGGAGGGAEGRGRAG